MRASDLTKLNNYEKELRKELDKEIKSDDDIIKFSNSVAEDLSNNSKTTVNFNNTDFMFVMQIVDLSYKKQHKETKEVIDVMQETICLAIIDLKKHAVLGHKLKPYTVKAVIDKRYSLKDNLKAVVESFARHITGNIKAEEEA